MNNPTNRSLPRKRPRPTNVPIGSRFGDWTTLQVPSKQRDRILCSCSCGIERRVLTYMLTCGQTKFCKDYSRHPEKRGGAFKHGMTDTKEYNAWHSMKARCLNPLDKGYMAYGGRGITVDPAWIESFEAFYAYIGPAPTPDHTLERMDVNGNYEPGNVKWATRDEQELNKRRTVWLECRGERKPLAVWIRESGIKESTLRNRLKNGWSVSKALSTPSQPLRRR